MLLPFLSEIDPKLGQEGSIDPLGIYPLAERLANKLLPGMTARMWRPRFLTAMAAASAVCEPFRDELAKDGVTPPWLVFEWYAVLALAQRSNVQGIDVNRVPGIDKARQARQNRMNLSARSYLKTSKVFGFHGVYKVLSIDLDILDAEMELGEKGYELLKIWEKENGLEGFADQDAPSGEGKRLRDLLRWAIGDSLKAGTTARSSGWQGWKLLGQYLAPGEIGPRERKYILNLLLMPPDGPRAQVFRALSRPSVRRIFEENDSEREFHRALVPLVSEDVAATLRAIQVYETVCRLIDDAFQDLLALSTETGASAVGREQFAAMSEAGKQACRRLPAAMAHAEKALDAVDERNGFLDTLGNFAEQMAPSDLFDCLCDHHERIQVKKPPAGKRSWFEHTPGGSVIVRPPYRRENRPEGTEAYVHGYRTPSVYSFLKDLGEIP